MMIFIFIYSSYCILHRVTAPIQDATMQCSPCLSISQDRRCPTSNFTHGHGLAVCTDTTHVPSPVHGSQTWVCGLNLDNFTIGRPKNGLMPQKLLRISSFSTRVHPKNPQNLWLFPGFRRFSQVFPGDFPRVTRFSPYRGKAAAELSEAAEHGALPRGRDLKTVLKVLLEAPGAQVSCGWWMVT